MAWASQPVLALIPVGAVQIGPIAALVEDPDEGGVVYVNGLATFCYDCGDEVGRRLAAVQLVQTEIARPSQVAVGFAVTRDTLWRWRRGFAAQGVAGLVPGVRGPKEPFKLTDEVLARIQELAQGGNLSLAAIGAQTGVSTATVRVALGRRQGSAGWEARKAADGQVADGSGTGIEDDTIVVDSGRADTDTDTDTGANTGTRVEDFPDLVAGVDVSSTVAHPDIDVDVGAALPVLAEPVARTAERALARSGLLVEATPVFTQGARLPLAGLWLALPALASTGLIEVFEGVYGRLRDGFYGLRPVLLTLVFLALLREPRAEGLTRVNPADLGRLLGLDRAPEVKTLRRKLAELTGYRRGAQLQRGLAQAHGAARPEAIGYLMVGGHSRAYFGTRDLPKTHVARLHMAARATGETWVADQHGCPVMVITAQPSASLAAELARLLPELRAVVGPDRSATLIFDRGGWSPLLFKKIIEAGFDLICWRKGEFEPLPDQEFTEQVFTDPDTATEHTWALAETTVCFDLGNRGELQLRQIHKRAGDGTQIPLVTSGTDLIAAQVCWRLGTRWRHENYFRYGRAHFALDALDSYTDTPDDPDRLVPNPAKKHAHTTVTAAQHALTDAQSAMAAVVDTAAAAAGRPGNHGAARVEAAVVAGVEAAREALDEAKTARADTPARVPLATVRPNARPLDEERKLLTHAIRTPDIAQELVCGRRWGLVL